MSPLFPHKNTTIASLWSCDRSGAYLPAVDEQILDLTEYCFSPFGSAGTPTMPGDLHEIGCIVACMIASRVGESLYIHLGDLAQ